MARTRLIAGLLAAALAAGATAAAAPGDRPAEPDEAALVGGNSEFAFDLYARLRARDGNLFLSPYSISNALAMTYAGARGPTAAQMAKTLRFALDGDRLHLGFAKIMRDLNGAGSKRSAELHVANALWSQAGFAIASGFQTSVRDRYDAGLQLLDFRRAPEKARATINAWVEQRTQDRIKDLVPEGLLTPATRLVLTNAIYFKGSWMRPFAADATRNETFTLSTGLKVGDVPLMRQRGSFRYLDGGRFQVLELPYEANELSMIVFLPSQGDGLAGLEPTLTAGPVADWLAKMTVHDVEVALPRFTVTAEFQLKPALVELGMALAFSEKADFSGIVEGQPLSLAAVVHKAYVDVNEKGTEAAAATAAAMMVTSAMAPAPRAVFRADHPFFFAIRDNRTGSLLFAGRVVNPQAK